MCLLLLLLFSLVPFHYIWEMVGHLYNEELLLSLLLLLLLLLVFCHLLLTRNRSEHFVIDNLFFIDVCVCLYLI